MDQKILAAMFISGILSFTPAFGEYRVFQYYIRSKVQNINPPKAELVTSTLDPASYVSYHGGRSAVEVNLLRSWVCMGDTSKKPVCSMGEGLDIQPKILPITKSLPQGMIQ